MILTISHARSHRIGHFHKTAACAFPLKSIIKNRQTLNMKDSNPLITDIITGFLMNAFFTSPEDLSDVLGVSGGVLECKSTQIPEKPIRRRFIIHRVMNLKI